MLRIMIFVFLIFSLATSGGIEVLNWETRVGLFYENMYHLLDLDTHERATFRSYRGLDKEKPGDYFMDIYSGNETIDSTMAKNILTQYQSYLRCEIPQTVLFSAQFCKDTSKYGIRNEYFIRYTDGKFVYVLSGWWPKFIKYYKAIPQNIRLNEDQLIAELDGILSYSKAIDSLKLEEYELGKYYLLKGFLHNVMVRNYKISARPQAPDLSQPPMFSPWYNIIEITIYLDKEFIP